MKLNELPHRYESRVTEHAYHGHIVGLTPAEVEQYQKMALSGDLSGLSIINLTPEITPQIAIARNAA